MALNWDDLKVVLAVARSGSLSRAARVLGVDQSTAGRRLTAVEADLGTTLFVRGKNGLSPTDLGGKVVQRATEIEMRVARLSEEAADTAGGPSVWSACSATRGF